MSRTNGVATASPKKRPQRSEKHADREIPRNNRTGREGDKRRLSKRSLTEESLH